MILSFFSQASQLTKKKKLLIIQSQIQNNNNNNLNKYRSTCSLRRQNFSQFLNKTLKFLIKMFQTLHIKKIQVNNSWLVLPRYNKSKSKNNNLYFYLYFYYYLYYFYYYLAFTEKGKNNNYSLIKEGFSQLNSYQSLQILDK